MGEYRCIYYLQEVEGGIGLYCFGRKDQMNWEFRSTSGGDLSWNDSGELIFLTAAIQVEDAATDVSISFMITGSKDTLKLYIAMYQHV